MVAETSVCGAVTRILKTRCQELGFGKQKPGSVVNSIGNMKTAGRCKKRNTKRELQMKEGEHRNCPIRSLCLSKWSQLQQSIAFLIVLINFNWKMIESIDWNRIPNNIQFETIVWKYFAKNKRHILSNDQLIVDMYLQRSNISQNCRERGQVPRVQARCQGGLKN